MKNIEVDLTQKYNNNQSLKDNWIKIKFKMSRVSNLIDNIPLNMINIYFNKDEFSEKSGF